MHPFDAEKPPQLALLLGYAGLVPFVSGALGIWVTPEGWRPFVLEALLDYAAVILAFMGAIHWGLAIRGEDAGEHAQVQLGLSVIPPLLGWLAISAGLPMNWATNSFSGRSYRSSGVPTWLIPPPASTTIRLASVIAST